MRIRLPTPGFQQGANNWIGNPSVFNNQRKDSIKIDWVPTSNHRVAVRHTWAPNVWNDPEPMGVYSTIWDYPGPHAGGDADEHALHSLINEFSFSWGSTSPSKYFGQRNCDYCPGGTDAFSVSDAAARSASTIRTCSRARSSIRTRFPMSR